MKFSARSRRLLCLTTSLLGLAAAFPALTEAEPVRPGLAAGADGVIVQSKFGGQIFGFDIDQNGNAGLLSEAQRLDDGRTLAAVETFDQSTGRILRVVAMSLEPDSDFITWGVVGDSVGLVERERSRSLFKIRRTFSVIDPLRRHRFTGNWTPPLAPKHLVSQVSRNQGTPEVAVYAMDISGSFQPNLFTSDVAANTFGPVIAITDEDFVNGGDPPMAFNSATHQAILGHATLGNPFIPGKIATVDLVTGAFVKFTGVGLGDVNGIAVDPVTNTVCTTTEIDFSVEFYNLAGQSGFAQPLPGAVNQFYSGADVQFDPLNRLFLVAQPNSSTSASGSSIHVYDVAGNLVESIDGLNFSNAGNVVPAHIALNPSRRTGFVDGPDPGVSQLQSFSY